MKLTLILSMILSGIAFAAPDKTSFKELDCVNNQAPSDGDNESVTLTQQEDGSYTLVWKQYFGGLRLHPVTQPAPVTVEGLSCDSDASDARLVTCESATDSFSLTLTHDRFLGDQFKATLNGKRMATFSVQGRFDAIEPDYCQVK